jgi:hypothetical protein
MARAANKNPSVTRREVKSRGFELVAAGRASTGKLNRFNFWMYLSDFMMVIDLILHSHRASNYPEISTLEPVHQNQCKEARQAY